MEKKQESKNNDNSYKNHLKKQVTIKSLDLENIKFDENGFLQEGYGNIKETIVCIRPGHKTGIPMVYAEVQKGKYISHDYGHSGVGFSIMFGTIEQSIENMLKLKTDFATDKEAEITVVGLGCIGLYTALKLNFMGYKNVKIVGESYEKTPSQWAGGLFEFSLNTIYKQENIYYLNEIFTKTFLEYKKIYEKNHEILSEGVKYVDYYTDFYEEGVGLSHLAQLGLIPKIQKVDLKIETNLNLEINLYHLKTFHIITKTFMDHMLYKVKERNIPVEFKKINNFGEIISGIIFNCSGLGSMELNNDKQVYPVCGHGFVLNKVTYSEHDYILRLSDVPGLKGNPIGGSLYFMPKTTGFIGGTYLKDYDGKDKEYNKMQITNLMKRARFLYHGIIPQEKKYQQKNKPKF